jgi:gliding motility-associated-like protein
MRHLNRISKVILLLALLTLLFPVFTKGQTVLNNNLLRFGTGSENSVNNSGNLQQPFYYNSTLALWRKLTFSTYPLDNSFAIGGDGSNEWNLNGTRVNNPAMSSQVIDLSGYILTSSPNGYGTIISTGTINIGGSNLEIRNTYELADDNAFIKITTKVKNISGSSINNVRYWVGTRDDYVGGTDQPKKEKGNLVDGAFSKITSAATRALALRISTADEGVLFYTNSSKGNNIINTCCDFNNVINTNPQLSSIEITNDGSYGFYVRMNDLPAGSSDEFSWYYASGKLADLETIIADVAAASGAVSDISYTTATFKAKTSTAGTGYWMVVPRNATTPTELQIKNGTNYGSVTVTTTGSGAMLANTDKYFNLTGLNSGTNYDLYFVSEDATPAFSSIAKVQFVTEAYTIPEISTNSSITEITRTTATSGGNISGNGGQPVTVRGVCWNKAGSPTISDSKTSDGTGSGTFSSNISGLTEGTTYHVRAYATNSVGTAYGSDITFTTLSTSLYVNSGGVVVAPNIAINIASNAAIIGGILSGATVSITSNFVSSQDVLGVNGLTSGTEEGISYSYNATTGVLSLNGSADASVYQSVLRKVTYSNSSFSPSTSSRTVKLSLNSALPFSGNGHYYEYISSTGITWGNAKTAAEGLRYFGLQGYLVTLTSLDESNFVISKLLGQGWLGASDNATEGTWKWVSGPENGTTLSYTNWNTGEPNDAGGEDCAQFLATGKWNDLNSTTTLTGYVVEYGGTASDPVLHISDNVVVTFYTPTAIAATNITGSSLTANWNTFSGATDYLIDVSVNSSFSSYVTGYQDKKSGNVTILNISNLNPVSTYYYRVRAVLSSGTSFNSNIISATTVKLNQSITFENIPVKTYGDASFNPGATASSELNVLYTSSNTDVATVSGNVITIVGAGTSTITASQSGNSSYNAAANVLKTLTVNKAQLTLISDNKTKIYGGSDPVLTYSVSGNFYNGDTKSVISGVTLSTKTVGEAIVGDHVITISGGIADDYNISTSSTGLLTVTKANLTITTDLQSKTYGSANPALTFRYSGFVYGENKSALTTEPIVSTTVDLRSPVNKYSGAITVSGGVDENYDFTYVPADFTVTKAMLTVTADDQSKVYGTVNPALTFTYSGWANEDEASVLTTEPVSTTAIDQLTSVNVYNDAITVSGGDDENYDFTYVPADFTVTKAMLTVTADDQSKVYGTINPALTFTYSGWANEDEASDLTTEPVSTTAIDQLTSVNVYNDAITVSGGVDENYDFTYVPADFTVTKAMLTVTADDKSKVYGTVNPSLTFTYSGWVNEDESSDLTTEPVSTTAIDQLTSVNVYNDAITVSGGDDENYNFIYVPADFTVTKAMLTVTADDQSKVYGTVNPALTFTYSGWVNGDDVSDLGTLPQSVTIIDETSSVGTYTNSIVLGGGVDDNYEYTYVSADFSITKAPLAISVDNKRRVYGEGNPELTVTYSGFKNNDDISDLDIIPEITTSVISVSPVGSYPIILTGGSDNNYSIILNNGIMNVEKATITATADNKSKIYKQDNPDFTISYSGFVPGEDKSVIDVIPVATSDAGTDSDAGNYGITLSGGVDNNYGFVYRDGNLTINKADQTINFGEIPEGLRMTEEFNLVATASSGLQVTFESSDDFIAGVSGNVLIVYKEGNVTIGALQQGDHNWNPAPVITRPVITLPTFDNINSLFSPNNDGMNDTWYIPDLEQYGKLQVSVYNRYGKLVYQSDGYKNDWDGTWHGGQLPSSSYYYIIKSSVKGMIKGVVNLVR